MGKRKFKVGDRVSIVPASFVGEIEGIIAGINPDDPDDMVFQSDEPFTNGHRGADFCRTPKGHGWCVSDNPRNFYRLKLLISREDKETPKQMLDYYHGLLRAKEEI